MMHISVTREEFRRRTGLEPLPGHVAMVVKHEGMAPIEYVFVEPNPDPSLTEADLIERLERIYALEDPRK